MVIYIAIGLLVAIIVLAVLTNPFERFSIVRMPFVARQTATGPLELTKKHQLIVRNQLWWQLFAYLKCGFHVLETRYYKSPRARSLTVKGIVQDIHRLRYDPNKLLLISGDHFSPLFVRNLGVFYYPMLDDRIRSDRQDWYNRQAVSLQTLAFALETFRQSGRLTTTIVSTSPKAVTCINLYAYPSDTLHGMLYMLAALIGKQKSRVLDYGHSQQDLQTQKVARQLLQEYKPALGKLYASYRRTVYEPRRGLVKRDLHLSGAKDITRRSSAFYDNVIFWRTTQLAAQLGIIKPDQPFLNKLKKRILDTFWLPEQGYFLEDLSDEGLKNHYYSSDWLVVLFTGFLDPTKKSDQAYFTHSIDYIQSQGIDQPFAIKYQQDTRAHRQFLAVRLAVASYGGDSIWSFWGMEYIKLLLILYRQTGNQTYLERADYHIKHYKQNMLRDAGFPEVYDKQGNLLQTPFYRSIRQTGWVIGFEQVLAMRRSLG